MLARVRRGEGRAVRAPHRLRNKLSPTPIGGSNHRPDSVVKRRLGLSRGHLCRLKPNCDLYLFRDDVGIAVAAVGLSHYTHGFFITVDLLGFEAITIRASHTINV